MRVAVGLYMAILAVLQTVALATGEGRLGALMVRPQTQVQVECRYLRLEGNPVQFRPRRHGLLSSSGVTIVEQWPDEVRRQLRREAEEVWSVLPLDAAVIEIEIALRPGHGKEIVRDTWRLTRPGQ